MNTRELIQQLEDIEAEHGTCEVRLACQPRWAFEYDISEVVAVDMNSETLDDDATEDDIEYVVYIGEGTQLGYLPPCASSMLGWR